MLTVPHQNLCDYKGSVRSFAVCAAQDDMAQYRPRLDAKCFFSSLPSRRLGAAKRIFDLPAFVSIRRGSPESFRGWA